MTQITIPVFVSRARLTSNSPEGLVLPDNVVGGWRDVPVCAADPVKDIPPHSPNTQSLTRFPLGQLAKRGKGTCSRRPGGLETSGTSLGPEGGRGRAWPEWGAPLQAESPVPCQSISSGVVGGVLVEGGLQVPAPAPRWLPGNHATQLFFPCTGLPGAWSPRGRPASLPEGPALPPLRPLCPVRAVRRGAPQPGALRKPPGLGVPVEGKLPRASGRAAWGSSAACCPLLSRVGVPVESQEFDERVCSGAFKPCYLRRVYEFH